MRHGAARMRCLGLKICGSPNVVRCTPGPRCRLARTWSTFALSNSTLTEAEVNMIIGERTCVLLPSG